MIEILPEVWVWPKDIQAIQRIEGQVFVWAAGLETKWKARDAHRAQEWINERLLLLDPYTDVVGED